MRARRRLHFTYGSSVATATFGPWVICETSGYTIYSLCCAAYSSLVDEEDPSWICRRLPYVRTVKPSPQRGGVFIDTLN